ncbi:hypothetical protein LCM4577_22930 [Mesorhizobium sp. LCM 4577]|nr:hypothetical protein LCM4576_31120 [Mesorhizobium sp. LCM 4576]OHV69090.1 hypothetical protein LCM4577_22930 [Mesorhizobium sp. LCM 4577]
MRLGLRSIPVEYFILRVLEPDATQEGAEGKVVGHVGGRPIFETVTDCFGERFHYVGLAPRDSERRYDIEALSPGEWIVEPGLIYRSESALISESLRNRSA